MLRSADARWRWVLLGLLVCAQAPLVVRPVGGLHRWRQADTAAVARNLAFESPDLLRPRIDVRGDRTGVTGMEFPAFQAVVALAMRGLGSGSDWIGKVVALGCTVAACLLLARLLERRLSLLPVEAFGALAASPALFAYGARFMPETFALALGALALERLDRWWAAGGTSRLATAGVAIGVAALVRPFEVFLGVPLLAAFLVLAARRDARAWAVLATGASALVPFVLWYALWAPHLVRAYGLSYFFTGNPLGENVALLGTADFWRTLGEVIAQDYVSWPLLPVAAWGAVALWKRAGPDGTSVRGLAFGMPLVTVTGVVLLTGRHFSPHTYYFMALVPPVAVWVAAGYHALGVRWPRALPWAALAVALSVPVSLYHYYFADRELARYGDVLADVERRVAPSDLVLVEDGGSYAWHLHPLRRRGWVEPTASVHEAAHVAALAARGCRWVLPVEDGRYALFPVDDWLVRLRAR